MEIKLSISNHKLTHAHDSYEILSAPRATDVKSSLMLGRLSKFQTGINELKQRGPNCSQNRTTATE